MVDPAPDGPAVPAAFVSDLLEVSDPAQKQLLASLVPALEQISPELVPRAVQHPLLDQIDRGITAIDSLFEAYKATKSEDVREDILTAIDRIVENEHATAKAAHALRNIMASTRSPRLMSVAARALARAGDEAFLEQQRHFLGSESFADVWKAAILLGYGRYTPAVPVLIDRLAIDQMAVADALIWALGEIGDERAVTKLHAFLERMILPQHVARALGKIGARVSVMRLLPLALEGTEPLRSVAVEAIGHLATKNEGSLGDPDLTRMVAEAMEQLVERDPSKKVRFYAMIAFARLGGHLEPSRILAALGGALTDAQAGTVKGLIDRRPRPKPGPKKGRGLV